VVRIRFQVLFGLTFVVSVDEAVVAMHVGNLHTGKGTQEALKK
jgi:hypothetical protein